MLPFQKIVRIRILTGGLDPREGMQNTQDQRQESARYAGIREGALRQKGDLLRFGFGDVQKGDSTLNDLYGGGTGFFLDYTFMNYFYERGFYKSFESVNSPPKVL